MDQEEIDNRPEEDEEEDDLLVNISLTTTKRFPFKVEGRTYYLQTIGSFDREKEGELQQLLRREQRLLKRLDGINPRRDPEGFKQTQDNLRACRIDLICLGTDVPRAMVEAMPLGAHLKILGYLGKDEETIEKERNRREAGVEDDEAVPA
jgi:hypothetical protein